MTRMAGQEERILPLLLAASGMGAAAGVTPEDAEEAREALRRIDPALLGALGPFQKEGTRDLRDYLVEPSLWRSDVLPLGVSIDQAIQDGTW